VAGVELSRSAAGGNHLRSRAGGWFCHLGAGQHAGDFVGAGASSSRRICICAAVVFALFDDEVLVSEGGDLGQVGDAEDLLAVAEA